MQIKSFQKRGVRDGGVRDLFPFPLFPFFLKLFPFFTPSFFPFFVHAFFRLSPVYPVFFPFFDPAFDTTLFSPARVCLRWNEFIWVGYDILTESSAHLTMAPLGMSSATVARVSLSPSDAARIMPWDHSPRNFTGFRFVTQITFLPTNSSGR